MNRAGHHQRAEQLLADARNEPNSVSRTLILAEAQVHATLALSAPAGEGPPGPRRNKAAETSPGELVPGHPGGAPAWQRPSSLSGPTS